MASFIEMERQESASSFRTAEDSNRPSTSATSAPDHRDAFHCNHTGPGHSKEYAAFDPHGPNVIHHENIFLKPVVHTTVRHIEVEEILRIRNIDVHQHHIQMHIPQVKEEPYILEDQSFFTFADPAKMMATRGGFKGTGEVGADEYNFSYQPTAEDSVERQEWSQASGASKIPYMIERWMPGHSSKKAPKAAALSHAAPASRPPA